MTGMKVLKVNKSGSVTIAAPGTLKKTPVNKDGPDAFTVENDKMVTGIFKNIESPGQPARVSMRIYKGQEPFNQVLEDGKTYTIPLSIAKMINKQCKYLKDKHQLDDDGNYIKMPDISHDRYQFVPNTFH